LPLVFKKMKITTDAIGWVGMVLILLAYYLVSSGKVKGSSISYQLLNLLGAIGVLINSSAQKAWPSAALNGIWASIALKTLLMGKKLRE